MCRLQISQKANPYYRKDAGNGKIERYLIDMDTYSGVYRVENPIYNATLNSFNLSERSKFDNKLNAELRFLPELVLRGRFGLGLSQTKSDNFISPGDPVYDNVSFDKKGEYKSGVGKSFYYDGDVTLSYGKVLGEKHQVNAVLGARMRSDEATSEENTSQGFPDRRFLDVLLFQVVTYRMASRFMVKQSVVRIVFILTADIRLITVIYWMRMFVWTVRLYSVQTNAIRRHGL